MARGRVPLGPAPGNPLAQLAFGNGSHLPSAPIRGTRGAVGKARFALFGASGFVARRHLEAIRSVGGELIAAVDPHDSVGILDRFALDARYFQREDDCIRYLRESAERERGIDYLAVCSPNDLHHRHIELGLRLGAHVICEKPLVIEPEDLPRLAALAEERGRQVHPVLQLRHHPALLALSQELPRAGRVQVELDYVTPRGSWYDASWKGDRVRSGGLLANIGIHFLDVLLWLFGDAKRAEIRARTARTVRGSIELERADVTFRLSIDPAELDAADRWHSRRRLLVQGREVVLETDLERLHDHTYRAILAGTGQTLEQARPSLDLCFALERSGRYEGSLEA